MSFHRCEMILCNSIDYLGVMSKSRAEALLTGSGQRFDSKLSLSLLAKLGYYIKYTTFVLCNETSTSRASGCGSVGRVVASDTRGLLFETHFQISWRP